MNIMIIKSDHILCKLIIGLSEIKVELNDSFRYDWYIPNFEISECPISVWNGSRVSCNVSWVVEFLTNIWKDKVTKMKWTWYKNQDLRIHQQKEQHWENTVRRKCEYGFFHITNAKKSCQITSRRHTEIKIFLSLTMYILWFLNTCTKWCKCSNDSVWLPEWHYAVDLESWTWK